MWCQFTLVADLSSTPLSLWLLHTGYVSTILNRRRWLPHIKSYDFTQRSQAERQAVNFIVQGLYICRYNYFYWTLFCNVCKVCLKVHKVSPPNSPWILSLNLKLTFPLWECTWPEIWKHSPSLRKSRAFNQFSSFLLVELPHYVVSNCF